MRCRLCKNTTEFLFAIGKWPLHRCTHCTFLQVTLKPSVNELTAIYNQQYFSEDKYVYNFATNLEHYRRIKLMQKFISPQSKVLDAGCATGDFVKFASPYFEMWGYDISNYAISEAKKLSPKLVDRFSSGSLENIKYSKDKFDAIVLWDVIEHTWEPESVLTVLNGLLKSGGYLFLSTPNASSPTFLLMRSKWAFMTPPEHLSFFSRPTIEMLLARLNMNILYWDSKGKWTTVGFFLYKLNRIFKNKALTFLRKIMVKLITRLPIYIPTGDIAYAVAKKN